MIAFSRNIVVYITTNIYRTRSDEVVGIPAAPAYRVCHFGIYVPDKITRNCYGRRFILHPDIRIGTFIFLAYIQIAVYHQFTRSDIQHTCCHVQVAVDSKSMSVEYDIAVRLHRTRYCYVRRKTFHRTPGLGRCAYYPRAFPYLFSGQYCSRKSHRDSQDASQHSFHLNTSISIFPVF